MNFILQLVTWMAGLSMFAKCGGCPPCPECGADSCGLCGK